MSMSHSIFHSMWHITREIRTKWSLQCTAASKVSRRVMISEKTQDCWVFQMSVFELQKWSSHLVPLYWREDTRLQLTSTVLTNSQLQCGVVRWIVPLRPSHTGCVYSWKFFVRKEKTQTADKAWVPPHKIWILRCEKATLLFFRSSLKFPNLCAANKCTN